MLLICADLNNVNGYSNALKEIARNLAAIGEDTLMLDLRFNPYSPKMPLPKRRMTSLGKARVQSKHFSIGNACSALLFIGKDFKRIRRYLKGSRRLQLNNIINYAYAKRYVIQLIKTYDPSIVHIHGFTLDLLPIYDAVKELGIPFVATAHGLYSFDNKIKLWFDRSLEKDLFTSITDAGFPITVVSSRVKEQAVMGFGVSDLSIWAVINGVDVDKFNVVQPGIRIKLRDEIGVSSEKTIFLAVGSIQERKNQIAVLEALSVMEEKDRSGLLYVVIGGGDSSSLQTYINDHNLHDNVRIMGRVSDKDLLDFYHLADFFIMTSTSEGFPLVFLEAMATGLPIVTFSDLEAANEIFDDNTMVLATSRNPYSLAKAMVEAKERHWNGTQIRSLAESWSWNKVCEKYVSVYELAISRGKKLR